jgi:hypothetical protein
MAEFVLHEGKKKGIYYGAIYRDGAKEFHAFGEYAKMLYNEDGDLTATGIHLAKGEDALMGFVHQGTLSEEEVSWEQNATEQDIGWLSSLRYQP